MENVLRLLLGQEAVSGEEISRRLGVTRAAVWKKIEQLRAMGVCIESAPRRGYRLVSVGDALLAPVVEQGLTTRWAGRPCVFLEQTDSTNLEAKRLGAKGAAHGTLVLAQEQSAGRGRRGRGWESQSGEGIFMTLLLRPQWPPAKTVQLSFLCAVAVARAVQETTGLNARIKWPNDVVAGGRKICGILLEMTANEQEVETVVVGAGINVHQSSFSPELSKTATSLDLLCGRHIARAQVVRAYLRAFEAGYERLEKEGGDALMEEYRALCVTLGSAVRVISTQETFTGVAQEIDAQGALVVVDEQGVRRTVLAGDVSVRGLMGYI